MRTPHQNFYPRSPCGERRSGHLDIRRRDAISIHALLAESDGFSGALRAAKHKFLSTLSLRRATTRRASRQQPAGISIHALLAESDQLPTPEPPRVIRFLSTLSLRRATLILHMAHLMEHLFLSTLSLRRATVEKVLADVYYQAFLSTLSLRRATGKAQTLKIPPLYFYPRSPCGERHARRASRQQPAGISIHALLAESDFACIGFH